MACSSTDAEKGRSFPIEPGEVFEVQGTIFSKIGDTAELLQVLVGQVASSRSEDKAFALALKPEDELEALKDQVFLKNFFLSLDFSYLYWAGNV